MRVNDKVVLVTGAARGQGRSHAIRLAEEGAAIIGIDICKPFATVQHFPAATKADLAETVDLVRAAGGQMFAAEADVRDPRQMADAVAGGLAELGRARGLDAVVANAAIISFARIEDVSEEAWRETLDVNLTGVWNTVRAAIPHLNDGASIILIGSTASVKGFANCGPYVVAKHGVVGMMKTLAAELGSKGIRANAIHPTAVATPMHLNDAVARLFVPGVDAPTDEQFAATCRALHLLPIPWVEPRDISNAVLFLASDEARYITGAELTVDAGFTRK